jgi:hypothetical protein
MRNCYIKTRAQEENMHYKLRAKCGRKVSFRETKFHTRTQK